MPSRQSRSVRRRAGRARDSENAVGREHVGSGPFASAYTPRMGLFEKDRLITLLEQLTKMLEAIRAALAAGNDDDALAMIREARTLVAGSLGGTLGRVDPVTVAALLGP